MFGLLVFCALGLRALAGDVQILVRDQAGRPVEGAIVWAEVAREKPPPPVQTEIVQKNRQFIPPVTVIPVGSVVRFPNWDNVQHHVYSFSTTKTFDIPLYIGESPQAIEFERPGIVTLGCNIHDWMAAYIVVLDTSVSAKTDATGAPCCAICRLVRFRSLDGPPASRRPGQDRRFGGSRLGGTELEVAPRLSEDSPGRQRGLPLKPLFSSVRRRLIVILLLLLAGTQAVTFVLVAAAERKYAQRARQCGNRRSHSRLYSVRGANGQTARLSVRLLSSDYAFSSTFARLRDSDDPVARATLESALAKLPDRIGIASFIRLISPDGQTIMDTLPPAESSRLAIGEALILRAERFPAFRRRNRNTG